MHICVCVYIYMHIYMCVCVRIIYIIYLHPCECVPPRVRAPSCPGRRACIYMCIIYIYIS